MSNMRGGNKYSGYTIIEVLIVLAISSFMFVIASQFISGKAADTSFRTGVNEMASRIQDAIDQVNSGQFSDVNIKCQVIENIVTASLDNTGSQGTNSPCVFVGKYMSFTNDSSTYTVDTLAGKRMNGANPSATLAAISPTAVSDLQVSKTISQGLKLYSPNTFFGIILGLGNLNGSGAFTSGAQNSQMYSGTLSTLSPTNNVVLCFTDGSRYGSVIVGESNSTMTARAKFYMTSNVANNQNNCKSGA